MRLLLQIMTKQKENCVIDIYNTVFRENWNEMACMFYYLTVIH
mgnify:CR=1 FL=1